VFLSLSALRRDHALHVDGHVHHGVGHAHHGAGRGARGQ